MTAKEVCEALGVSLPTLYRRIAEGDIKPLPKPPGAKKRYRLEFAKSEVERLLRAA